MKVFIQWVLDWWFQRSPPVLMAWHAQQMMKTSKNVAKAVEERIKEEARAGYSFAMLTEFSQQELNEIQEDFEQRGFIIEQGLIRWL